MPVDRNSHSGVCTVIAGSRITARGMMRGWRNSSFTLCRSSVTPAMALNSPADSVVGTLICRTDRRVAWRRHAPFTGRSASSASGVRTSLARQSCTALAPSVIEPPPMVTIRSARASRACSAASITALARRVRRHPVEHADTAIAERAADLVDLVGLAVQRAADHQEHALRVRAPVRRSPARRARRTAPPPSG